MSLGGCNMSIFTFCFVCLLQGDPIEWVSDHRYHHLHTDTPLDPHSPYEGFWWAHMGWLWDDEVSHSCCSADCLLHSACCLQPLGA